MALPFPFPFNLNHNPSLGLLVTSSSPPLLIQSKWLLNSIIHSPISRKIGRSCVLEVLSVLFDVQAKVLEVCLFIKISYPHTHSQDLRVIGKKINSFEASFRYLFLNLWIAWSKFMYTNHKIHICCKVLFQSICIYNMIKIV